MRFRRNAQQGAYWDDKRAARDHARLTKKQLRSPEEAYPFRLFLRALRAWDSSRLPMPAILFDVGCGAGAYSELLEREVPERFFYSGFDVSAPMVNEARRLFPDRSFTVADVEEVDLDTPDVVLASGLVDVVEDYQPVLERLLSCSAPALILHRQAVEAETKLEHLTAYGLPSVRVILGREELNALAQEHGRRLTVDVHEPGEVHRCLVLERL